jgi:hypothetical protein
MTTMLLDTIFAPFVKERPICVMARAVLERLLDAPRIDALFARTAQQQYTRELLFSSLVQLMSEVVLGVHPTVHAAYQANKAAIGVSTTALYNKLDRVEPGVSAALVRDSAELVEPVVKALRASHPRWLPGYQSKVLDGHHLSSTARRLKAWRSTWAAPLPGHALVVLDQQRRLIYEHSMLVRAPDSGETMRVRRLTITLKEPTRDGDPALHLLSNVPLQRAAAAQLARLYGKRWRIGVSREGHRNQSVEVRPRRKDSSLVAWEAPWRANKTVEPSDNMRSKAHAQHTRLQRTVNADVASLHAIPVAETVDNVRRQQGLAERSLRRQPSPAGSQR